MAAASSSLAALLVALWCSASCRASATAPAGLEVSAATAAGAWGPWQRCEGAALATGVVVAVASGSSVPSTALGDSASVAAPLRLLCQSPGAPEPSATPASWREQRVACPAQTFVAGLRAGRGLQPPDGGSAGVVQADILCRGLGSSTLVGARGAEKRAPWREAEVVVCPEGTLVGAIRASSDGAFSLDCVRVATDAQQQQQSSAVISFEGSEGDWGAWDQCEGYSFAAGMQTLSQESQGRGDDTALNGVQLACSNASGQQLSVFRPHSSVGPWGTWDQPQTCPPGFFIAGFKVQNDESGSDKDGTGLNRIVFICRYGDKEFFSGELGKTNGGEWSQEYLCPPGHAVSAIQTRLQARQGRGDDTALNGIRMRCQSTEDSCGGCLNGGTCAQTTASCQCTADFGGQHCEIDRTRRLSFNSQNKFRIVQFTDLHYNIGSENDRTDAVQRTVLQLERPDLVVITGDELSGTSISSRKRAVANWNRITAVASSMGIKWALVFGNHDDDGPLDRQEMFTLDSAKTGSLTLSGPADLYGESNYYLPIFSGANLSGTAPASVLWMLGVTDGSCEGASGEGCVTRIQVDWFQRSAKELSQRWNKVESPFSLMFFHIPVPEFAEAWESNGTCFGTRGEKESSPNANTGLFDAAYNLGVRGMFVGHDHKNDLCGALPDRPQLLMCYGRKSGYGYYNPEAPTYRGARVIELALGPTGEVTMDTWIRDEWGYKIIKTVCDDRAAASDVSLYLCTATAIIHSLVTILS
eukprot:m51a1_g13161 hypothetical protein (755) ;mRNA; r:56447-59204